MKNAMLTCAAMLGLAVSAPASAQVPGVAAPPAEANPGAPLQDKVICRATKVVGSRLKAGSVCKTAAEWRAEQAEQRRTVEKGQNQRVKDGN